MHSPGESATEQRRQTTTDDPLDASRQDEDQADRTDVLIDEDQRQDVYGGEGRQDGDVLASEGERRDAEAFAGEQGRDTDVYSDEGQRQDTELYADEAQRHDTDVVADQAQAGRTETVTAGVAHDGSVAAFGTVAGQRDQLVDHDMSTEAAEESVSTGPDEAAAVPTGQTGTPRAIPDGPTRLFGDEQVEQFRIRWTALQGSFVDEPRSAVQEADELVAEVMQALSSGFAERKQELEGQWSGAGAADTEELRLAIHRYRSLLDQLLRI